MEENKYPCTYCMRAESCTQHSTHRKCKPFMKWFSAQWKRIKILFGVECVESTLEREECDNK